MILILVMLALGVVAMVAGSLCLRAQRSLQAGTRQETALTRLREGRSLVNQRGAAAGGRGAAVIAL